MAQSNESAILEALVARAAVGDQEARHAIVVGHSQIINAALRLRGMPRDRADSIDDLVQESMFEILKSLPKVTWQGRSRFIAWMKAIADHTRTDLHRREIAQKRGGAARPVAFESAQGMGRGTVRSIESVLDDRRQHEALASAYDALSPDEQDLLKLHADGFSFQDLGDLLNCSPDAARKRHARLLARVTREMKHHPKKPPTPGAEDSH